MCPEPDRQQVDGISKSVECFHRDQLILSFDGSVRPSHHESHRAFMVATIFDMPFPRAD